jgi:hypothetical protein
MNPTEYFRHDALHAISAILPRCVIGRTKMKGFSKDALSDHESIDHRLSQPHGRPQTRAVKNFAERDFICPRPCHGQLNITCICGFGLGIRNRGDHGRVY